MWWLLPHSREELGDGRGHDLERPDLRIGDPRRRHSSRSRPKL